jgi:hypothetical protein
MTLAFALTAAGGFGFVEHDVGFDHGLLDGDMGIHQREAGGEGRLECYAGNQGRSFTDSQMNFLVIDLPLMRG